MKSRATQTKELDMLLVVERMYGKVRVRSVRRDEIIDFSIGIASNVLYGRCAVGTLVEPTPVTDTLRFSGGTQYK